MSNFINVKIKLSKVQKEHFYVGATGEKFLDIRLVPCKENQYGDTHIAFQEIGKEKRLAGQRGPIIGNGKEFEPKPTEAEAPQADAKQGVHATTVDEDCPF